MTKKVLISFEDIDGLYKAMAVKIGLNDFFAGYAKCTADLIEWLSIQPAALQWVSVEDGLPKQIGDENETLVLFKYAGSKEFIVVKYIFCDDGEEYFEGLDGYSIGEEMQDYWMPIPPLPEVGRDKHSKLVAKAMERPEVREEYAKIVAEEVKNEPK